jgi:hypothetical protein
MELHHSPEAVMAIRNGQSEKVDRRENIVWSFSRPALKRLGQIGKK